jgi:hypothetical protein
VLRLRLDFEVALPVTSIFASAGLPGARAVLLGATSEAVPALILAEPERAESTPLASFALPRAGLPGGYDLPALCRVGDGFALVTDDTVALWRSFAHPPARLRHAPLRADAYGRAPTIGAGGLSDDPDAALLFFHGSRRIDETRRFTLLRLDVPTGEAHAEWLTDAGLPLALDEAGLPPRPPTRPELCEPPLLHHGSFVGGRLRLFSLGFGVNVVRWGMDFAAAVRLDGSRVVETWVCEEPAYGTFASSGRYLMLRPLRAGGAWKGSSRALDLDTGELHALALPRGRAKYRLVDHCDGIYWLLSPYSPDGSRIAACHLDE